MKRLVLSVGVVFLGGCEEIIPEANIPEALYLPEPEGGERWLCKDSFDAIVGVGPRYDPSIVLTRETVSHYGYGRVSVAGVVHEADFVVNGVNRRWNWSCYGDGCLDAIIIDPDGRGGYYDFRVMEDGEDTVRVRQTLKCVQG